MICQFVKCLTCSFSFGVVIFIVFKYPLEKKNCAISVFLSKCIRPQKNNNKKLFYGQTDLPLKKVGPVGQDVYKIFSPTGWQK